MMDHLTAFKSSQKDQSESSLFTILPGEIRDRVYSYALSLYNSENEVWHKNSSWVRPGYDAPQTADTALLRTCQKIYSEAWFRPWLSADHSFWLAWAGRRPDDKQRHTATSFQPVLTQLFSLHGKVEIDHVRVFAQLCSLENGSQLSQILDLDCFYPRVFTVTVRHHDWWNWEGDSLLSIGSEWVNNCQFPESVVQLRVELESLQRKKNQIDYVAAEMIKNWQFSRNDNIVMMAHAQDLEVSAWSGSSTWEGERWIRDETKPETNEYYVKTVVFTPNKALARKDRQVAMHIRCPGEAFETLNGSTNCLRVCDLEKAQVTPGMSADEAKKLVTDWIRAFGPTYYETYDGYYDPDEDDEDEGIEILPHPDDDGENEVSNDEGRAGASSQDLAKEH